MVAVESASLIDRLDDSMLVRIFEERGDRTGKDLSSVLCLIRVCTRWSRLATPLLFRYLTLDILAPNSSRLHALVRHVQLQATNVASPCSYIQSISCHVRSNIVTAEVRDMTYIFLNISNLRSLVFDGAAMAPNVLQVAFHATSDTLQFLELNVVDAILLDAQHIGRLQRLQSLDMTSRADWSKAYLAWDLPCLTRLNWKGCMDGPSKLRCSGDVDFLKKCRFPILERLSLKLTQAEEPPETEVSDLRHFLAPMAATLVQVSLHLLPQQCKAILPFVRAQHVSLLQSPITPEIVECLHPSTQVLSLVVKEDTLDGFWQFLNALSTHNRTLDLWAIKVTSLLTHPRDFTWDFKDSDIMNIPRESAEFVGRMLGFSMRLKARGVCIVDESGAGFGRRKAPTGGTYA